MSTNQKRVLITRTNQSRVCDLLLSLADLEGELLHPLPLPGLLLLAGQELLTQTAVARNLDTERNEGTSQNYQ